VRPFVRLWVHAAMASLGGEKMSKSLGNLVFVDDLLRRYPAGAIRLYLLSHHRRQAFEWSEDRLAESAVFVERLKSAVRAPDHDGGAREAFRVALEDDVDTGAAVAALDAARGSTLRELTGVLGLRLE
jgi:cysteinyl-tRNA synthetase